MPERERVIKVIDALRICSGNMGLCEDCIYTEDYGTCLNLLMSEAADLLAKAYLTNGDMNNGIEM